MKNNGTCSVPVSNTTTTGTTCQAGYVYTQYGCLQQCPTNPSYAVYNGTCSVPVTSTGTTCPAGEYQTVYGCQI